MSIISKELSSEILKGWRILDAKQDVGDYPCGAPEPDEIDHIFRMAFYASIQREEANFVTFSLMFIPTHKIVKPRHILNEFNDVFELVDPVELTVENIKKLADANDEKVATLAVEKRSSQYFITAIVPFGHSPSMLRNLSGGGYPRPEALTVTVRSPGSLSVSRSNSMIGRFVSGRFEMAQVTPFHSRALGSDLIECVQQHSAYKTYETSYWHWYSEILEHLLRSTSERGHGGTIIWLPQKSVSFALSAMALGHTVKQGSFAYKFFLEILEKEADGNAAHVNILQDHTSNTPYTETNAAMNSLMASSYLPQLKAKLTTLINAIAQMACIDGATLIDDYFAPVRFGARLQAKEWGGAIRYGVSPTFNSSEEIPRGRFGTRHNSAIDFVAEVPKSIAFVISQDGPVRAITRRQDTVFIWPDCFNTMFVD